MPVPGYTPSSAWAVTMKWLNGCGGKHGLFAPILGPIWEISEKNSGQMQMLATTILVVLLSALILKLWKGPGGNMPGPRTFWPLSRTAAPDDVNAMVQLANKYGTVFKLASGIRTTHVVVCDPAVAAAVLIDSEAFLPKPYRPQQCVNEMLQPSAHPCLLTNTHPDKTWRSMRRCIAKSFTVEEIREDFEVAKDKALAMVEVLSDIKKGAAVDMAVMASSLSLDVFGVAKLGYDFESVEAKGDVPVLALLKGCQEELALRKSNPWRRLGWLVSDEIADDSIKYNILHAFISQVWSTIQKRGSPPEDNHTLAAQLMRLWRAKAISDTMVQTELAGMLLAGHEALGQSLAWAMQLLAAHPGAQDKLHQELKDAGFVAHPDNLAFDNVGGLKYLDAVVREVLRLHPTFGCVVTREATKDLTLGNYKIPRGSLVCVCPYAMHRCARLWLHPTTFMPERWQAEGAHIGNAQDPPGGQAGIGATGAALAGARHNGMATWPDVQQAHAAMMGASDQQGPMPPGDASASKDHGDKGAGDQKARTGEGSSKRSSKGKKKGGKGNGSGAGQGGALQEQPGKQRGKEGAAAGKEKQEQQPQLCASQAFMPFGMGQRSCVGQVFAQATLKAIIAILVTFYDFKLAIPHNAGANNYLVPLRFKLRDLPI